MGAPIEVEITAEITQELSKACTDDENLDYILDEIKNKFARLLYFGGKNYAVVRLEKMDIPPCYELVLILGVGKNFIHSGYEYVKTVCKANNYYSVRTHTINPAIVRIAKKHGFIISETKNAEYILRWYNGQ